MINKIEIKGSVFTIFTFFKKNRKLDYLTIKKYINFLYKKGARQFYMMPYNGRYSQLSFEEIKKLNSFCIKCVKSKKDTIIIVSDPIHASTQQKLDFAVDAKKKGADIFSSICREKFFSEEQIVNHYKKMSRAKIPILVHCMPFLSGYTAQNMKWPISLLKKIIKIKNVVAIKEDTKEVAYCRKLLSLFHKKINLIFAGRKKFLISISTKKIKPIYLNGISMINPRIDEKFISLMKNNNENKIKQFVKEIDDPFWDDLVAKFGWHRCNKAILECAGFGKRYERLPMKELSLNEYKKVYKFFKKRFKHSESILNRY